MILRNIKNMLSMSGLTEETQEIHKTLIGMGRSTIVKTWWVFQSLISVGLFCADVTLRHMEMLLPFQVPTWQYGHWSYSNPSRPSKTTPGPKTVAMDFSALVVVVVQRSSGWHKYEWVWQPQFQSLNAMALASVGGFKPRKQFAM